MPDLFGVPYTLWVGILICIALVVLTIIGALVHPSNKSDEQEAL